MRSQMNLVERANAGDPQAAIELMRRVDAQTSDEMPLGYATLRLHKPRRHVYSQLPRSLSAVDVDLCRLFGELAAGREPWPLLVMGDVGTGKTFAGLAFADMVPGTYFLTLEQACNAVMEGKRPWESTKNERGDFLVLDEIGERTKGGDLQYTTLKGIIDDREFKHGRIGMYITNLSPAELGDLFDHRVVSRLTAGTVVKLVGPDRRRQSRKDG